MVHDTSKRWEAAMDETLEYLVNEQGGKYTLVEVRGKLNFFPQHMEMSHLSCFAPGMLALGASKSRLPLTQAKRQRYLRVAEGLADGLAAARQVLVDGRARRKLDELRALPGSLGTEV